MPEMTVSINRQEELTCCYIIPARGGSKRIKDKNLQEIDGKPLIQWPVAEAKKMNLPCYVSSDSDDILDAAGDVIKLKRPSEFSVDDDRWGWFDYHFKRGDLPYDLTGLRQCTSPFLDSHTAHKAFQLAGQTGLPVATIYNSLGDISIRKSGLSIRKSGYLFNQIISRCVV